MTTKITEKNISNLANAGVQWQSVITADGSTTTTLVAGRGYFIDTTSAAHTVILPTSPNVGDIIQIRDYAGTFGTNNVIIDRNGHNLGGSAVNGLISSNNTFITYVYVDSTKGWLTLEAEAQSNPLQPLFTEATGGTVTTSGDYKIHTFTGDGCFVVSQAGNDSLNPSGGPNTVSYLVVAGGGGGGFDDFPGIRGAAGAGAGGFREGRDIGPSYTASPLVAPTGLTITATTYPVTVGAGGAAGTGGPNCNVVGVNGSNSVFSTITSAGGGGGGGHGPGNNLGLAGGSGGGGSNGVAGSAGNTPPVSPPQGQPGGSGSGGAPYTGGGGGGATQAGGNGSPSANGNGGNGASTSITGSSVTRAGGGGGHNCTSSPGSGGSGGGGSGGNTGNPGSANTGGGGSGGGYAPSQGNAGAGGKGIVVIRYKYQ